MNDDVFINRIALTLIDGVGDVLAKQLISYCGSAEAVFKEKRRVLESIPDIGPKTAKAIIAFKDFERAEKELAFIRKHSIEVYFYLDEDYPHRLKHCPDAPVLLYYKGTASLNKKRMVAIVGTRNATDYGKNFTTRLVEELAAMHVSVVSGLAYGIDITAHKACVSMSVETIGVLAHGLDRVYPFIHSGIARKMVACGGLITEHISGANPDKENFPKRNRIIAGLCDAVVVVEAATKGGALITAEIADSYNRDVFALPGRIDDVHSEGCNLLIKSHKASMLQSAADIRYIMGWDDEKQKSKPAQTSLFVQLSEEEKIIIGILSEKSKAPVDDIYIRSGMVQSKVASLLLNLEFSGLVRCLPGKIYELV